jgi:hypothetical protein
MSQEKYLEEKNYNNWLWIIVALIIGFFLYLAANAKIKKANKDLNDHLQERNEALKDIFNHIEYYRKRKVEMLFAKRQSTWFLRCLVSIVLLLFNGFYIQVCYQNDITVQHVFEGIATFNAAILFLTGILTFVVFGNFFEIKTFYHSFQTFVLMWLFKKDEETIESLQRLDLDNREAIRKEIIETTNAIKQNEELINQNAQDWAITDISIEVQLTTNSNNIKIYE